MIEQPLFRLRSDSDHSPSILMTRKRGKFSKKRRPTMTAQEMEDRRVKAVNLYYETDLKKSEVAKKIGVSRAAMSKWLALDLDDNGLKCKRRGVRSPIINHFTSELVKQLAVGATKQGWPDDKWTSKRLIVLIEKMTGCSQSRTSIKRFLNRIGWEYVREEQCWNVNPTKQKQALAALKNRCWILDS